MGAEQLDTQELEAVDGDRRDRSAISARKTMAVIDWLVNVQQYAVRRASGLVILATDRWPDGRVELHIEAYSEARLAQWFNASTDRMRREGECWDDAMVATWPDTADSVCEALPLGSVPDPDTIRIREGEPINLASQVGTARPPYGYYGDERNHPNYPVAING